MPPWSIQWSRQAVRDLEGFATPTVRRIVLKVEAAAADPHRFFTRLVGAEDYKLRVGDYRVLALLSPETQTILVERVGHRSTIYRE